MKQIIIIFLLAIILCSYGAFSVSASDKNGHFELVGAGVESCGSVLYKIQSDSNYEAVYGAWIAGYLSAYSELTDNTYSILGHTDLRGAFQWSVQYCQQHPIENYNSAVYALVRELYSNRLRSAP